MNFQQYNTSLKYKINPPPKNSYSLLNYEDELINKSVIKNASKLTKQMPKKIRHHINNMDQHNQYTPIRISHINSHRSSPYAADVN